MAKYNETPALGRIRGSERCYRSDRLDGSDGTVSPQRISESLVWAREDSPFFDFADEGGQLMWTFPVYDEIAVIDCVAWRRERPERWWLRTGAAKITSPRLFRRAIEWNAPLHLVATPEEWVGDPCHCACILQPDKVDLSYELQRLPLIECSEELEAYFIAEIRRRAIEKLNFGRPACR